MYEHKEKLAVITREVEQALKQIDLAKLRARIDELNLDTQRADFWNNQEKAQKANKELADLNKEVAAWEAIKNETDELNALLGESDKH